jgi:hypothetical protein
MTRKDYQAIARALFCVRAEDDHEERGGRAVLADVVEALADVLATDNPRFDRATFLAACEDGNVGRQPRTVHKAGRGHYLEGPVEREPLPLCAQAMGCLCAGHARGNKASEPCDTRERG